MTEERAWLSRYLAVGLMIVAGLEWSLGRVVSRLAAAPPLSGIGRTIVETLGRTGFFLLSTSFLLAAALLLICVWRLNELARAERHPDDVALSVFLGLFALLDIVESALTASNIITTEGWLTSLFNIFAVAAVWWLTLRFLIVGRERVMAKVAVTLVAVAYSCWYYSILFATFSIGGLTIGSTDILHVGELAAVLAPIAFFNAVAFPNEWRHPTRWIAPILVALAFVAGNIADIIFDQGYSGVFSIWSVGFTLWMPFPIYALSLALFLYAVRTCFVKHGTGDQYGDANIAMGMLLLLFAGYYLQLTYQHLLAILAIALLTRVARPIREMRRTPKPEPELSMPEGEIVST